MPGSSPAQRNDGRRRSFFVRRSDGLPSSRGKVLRRPAVNRAAARPARRVDAVDLRFPAVDCSQPTEFVPSLKVLHVVEALGSGIATALEDYIRSTPGHAHTVLGYRRPGAQTGDRLERLATRLLLLPKGRLAQIRTARRWVRELRPDVIHAHSTYAGLYVRLFVRAPAATLVYTPHAYPFERRDIPAALRGVYWLIEALLSLRGGCVAAVGPHEAELAERLPGKQVVVQLPNVVRSVRPAPPASVQVGRPRASCGSPCWDGSHRRRARTSSGVPLTSARPWPCRSGGSGSAAVSPRTSGRFARRGRR
jgi:Glycosyl transferase 4-like domain